MKKFIEILIDENVDLNDIKKNLKGISSNLITKKVNIGPGADWILHLLILTIPIFFLGKKINENLVAWIDLSKKFKKFIYKLRKRKFFIDSQGATLIAIFEIIKKIDLKKIEVVKEIELTKNPIKSYFFDKRSKDRIHSKPYRLFLKIFYVNDSKFYVIGIKSDGIIIIFKEFSDFWEEFHLY
jgi:hypothetical protein